MQNRYKEKKTQRTLKWKHLDGNGGICIPELPISHRYAVLDFDWLNIRYLTHKLVLCTTQDDKSNARKRNIFFITL